MSQGGGWQALFWNNHDQPRALDRFANPKHYRVRSAELLAASIHLSRGTPYIYMGETIGMSDSDYTSMADYVDIEAHNAYKELLARGVDPDQAFAIIHPENLMNFAIASAVTLIAGFLLTYFFGYKESDSTKAKVAPKKRHLGE